MTKFLDLFKDIKHLIILAITCTAICCVGIYRNFDFIEIYSFKLSFDFLFFVALVVAIVSWLILVWQFFSFIIDIIKKYRLYQTLKKCTLQEKDFLYFKFFINGNERTVDLDEDSYFYRPVTNPFIAGRIPKEFYRGGLASKESMGKFLRALEKKHILKTYGNKTMIITNEAWDILTKKSDKIFEKFTPLQIIPTDEKIKWAKVVYNTMSKEHKVLLKKIIKLPASEYTNVKIVDKQLAARANQLKTYAFLQDFQVDFLDNVCIITFQPELYSVLEIILNIKKDK